MKKHVYICAMALLAAAFLGSCRNDIDLRNIDGQAKVDLGLALPLGSIRAAVGDFLGDSQVPGIYVGADNALVYRDTFNIKRKFHEIDLKDKISDTDKKFDVYNNLTAQGLLDGDDYITTTGKQIKMEFPFRLELQDVNDDLSEERIDSALIKNAWFTSRIGRTSLPLEPGWIDSIVLVLIPDDFRRPTGIHLPIVGKKGDFAYNKNIRIDVDQFTLDLLKDHSKGPGDDNVQDYCDLQINFYFTLPKGKKVQITPAARYNYHLNVEFVDFEAIWGFFKPSEDMRDEDSVILGDEWEKWKDLSKVKLTVSEPSINLNIHSKIAGAMIMNGDYLFVKSFETGEIQYATFKTDDVIKRVVRFDGTNGNEYLDPKKSVPGDSIIYNILFDSDNQRGRIDRLFAIRPDMLGYKFNVEFDAGTTPQIRMPRDTRINMEACINIPFKFRKGVEAGYKDTLRDINIASMSLDSIAENTKLIDTIRAAQLKLEVAIENNLPFRVLARLRFFDENGNIVKDPTDSTHTKPLLFGGLDTLIINPPEMRAKNNVIEVEEPTRTYFEINIDKKNYETFTSIKQMEYLVEIDAEHANPLFTGANTLWLSADHGVKATLGIAAQTEAILNFGSDKKEGEQK